AAKLKRQQRRTSSWMAGSAKLGRPIGPSDGRGGGLGSFRQTCAIASPIQPMRLPRPPPRALAAKIDAPPLPLGTTGPHPHLPGPHLTPAAADPRSSERGRRRGRGTPGSHWMGISTGADGATIGVFALLGLGVRPSDSVVTWATALACIYVTKPSAS